jgi:hypothetical protein
MGKQGIILLALGQPHYGNYAANLAMSIKFNLPDMPIALLHDDTAIRHISGDKRIKLFDQLVEVPKEIYQVNGESRYIRTKNFLYSLTPFEETLFLDADIVLFPNVADSISKLINELSEFDFSVSSRGFYELDKLSDNTYSQWVKIEDVKKAYGLKKGRYYGLHSEFFWFKKTAKNDKFFSLVESITADFDSYKVITHDHSVHHSAISLINEVEVRRAVFASGTPDELPYAIAMAKMKQYPHKDNFTPIYWELADYNKLIHKVKELYSQYIGLSWGGNRTPAETTKLYNLLVKFYTGKGGYKYFPLIAKKTFANGRNNF